ncbi:uncharacterized protein STEHIDRAFT_22906, partial [Stereum hirsutum FP-91666 SS1]|uniref:uncharacterized protein n=1 Tax=Stereum hirsutum (strain FP-91666) TaxID=721885 RepID=UPI0004449883
YIKRPANSFILFRKDFMQGEYARMSREEKALVQEMQIHTVISEKWRALTPSERAFWDAKAAEAKAEHMRNNPEYRYQPTKKPAG